MAGIKDRIEVFFENFAGVLYTHRIKTLLLLFVLIGATVYKLPDLKVDTNAEALLKDNDPYKVVYTDFRDRRQYFFRGIFQQIKVLSQGTDG